MSAAKRKLADVDSEAMGHGRDSTPGGPSSKRSKTQKVKPDNMPWVRKRARTIERLLRTSQDLPANVQNDLERELGHHRSRIAKSAEDKQRKDMISKYHMVRFFERKKADRLAKRLRTQLGSTEDEAEKKDIAANLRVAEMDGVYARFFPHRERYISLYPVAESGASAKKEDKAESASKAVQALKSERPPIWYEIERAERKGMSALVAIRERNLNASFGKGANATELPTRQPKRDDKPSKTHPERPIMAAKAAKAAEIPDAPEVPMNRRTRREHERSGRTQKVAEDNDSDGGFFE
ncbi:rRNA-processing protein Efg1 [Microdochium nivale]|nr:rRNA-processing protein Efg1 [Microdochium nivale]